MDARWQDKLIGSSVQCVFRWRLKVESDVIARCEEVGYSKLYRERDASISFMYSVLFMYNLFSISMNTGKSQTVMWHVYNS